MNERLLVLVFFLAVLYPLNAIAQNNVNKSLTDILLELRERFDVRFNYASDLAEQVELPPPDRHLTLQQSLDYLQQQLNIDLRFISETTIAITKKKNTLCGYVKDKDSGEALPYVTIRNGATGTITNEEGYFQIELHPAPAANIVQISHIGHKPLVRDSKFLKDSQCNILYLIPFQEKLEEIVLYEYVIKGISKINNGSYKIDFDDNSLLPGLLDEDVLQSVQAFPGIQSVDESVSNINIRGGSNDQNLFTWDNIKMYQSGHFFGLISMYNPFITDKVILRKNGSPANLTDGVSGSIIMQTDDYLNPNFKGGVSLNLIDAAGFVDAPIGENISLKVAARKSLSDFVDTPTYSAYFERIVQNSEINNDTNSIPDSDIDFNFYDVAMRLLYHPSDKDRIRVNFIQVANGLTFNESGFINGNEEVRESTVDQNSIAGSVHYEKDWTKTLNTELTVYNTDYLLKGINANVQEDQRFLQENSVSETGAKISARKKVGQGMEISAGYQFFETKIRNLDDVDDPRFVQIEGEVLREHALWTSLGLESADKMTKVNLGLRYNYLAKFQKHIIEPRLSVNHGFWDFLNLELLGEFKHQSTSQIITFQNDFLGIEKRRWQLSNDSSIPIITSKQVSLGINYNKNGWLVNGVFFYKDVEGITSQSQGFLDSFEFATTQGDSRASGVDILLRKRLQKNNIWLSYSYLDSKYRFDELFETEFPSNFDITHSLTMGANYTIKNFMLATGLNLRSGRPFTNVMQDEPIAENTINYATVNSERQTPFMRLDFSATYRLKVGPRTKARFGLSLWNVLDRNNVLNTFYRIDENDEIQKVEQFSLGFTPNVSARIIFD